MFRKRLRNLRESQLRALVQEALSTIRQMKYRWDPNSSFLTCYSRGKRHLLVFQWGGEQPIEWSLVLSPYSVGPVIAISLSLPCPALSSFTRSTLPPCIDIGSAWESAIEWGSLIAVGEVPGCSPPFLGTSLSTGCSFPRSVFLSSVFSSFSFLTCHLQGNAIC